MVATADGCLWLASLDVVGRRVRLTLVWLVLASGLTACGPEQDGGRQAAPRTPSSLPFTTTVGPDPVSPAPSRSQPIARSSAASRQSTRGTAPPSWLGTRVLPVTADGYGEVRHTPRVMRVSHWNTRDSIPMLPGAGFKAILADPAPKHVVARSTWRPGCPVDKDDLAWIRMTYWGFDNARHSGEMLVNGSAADDLVDVFRQLYRAKFPIESMGIAQRQDLDAPPTGDGNVTGAFACRPIRGGTEYSQHAFGLAVDLNPFQNPYHRGDMVLPELASAYLDRHWLRPGMIKSDGPALRAFASIGWHWGGTWSSLQDYQHFSVNGR